MGELVTIGGAAVAASWLGAMVFSGGNLLFGMLVMAALLPYGAIGAARAVPVLIAVQTAVTSLTALLGHRREWVQVRPWRRWWPLAASAWASAAAFGRATVAIGGPATWVVFIGLAIGSSYLVAFPDRGARYFGWARHPVGLWACGIAVGVTGGVYGLGGGFLLIPVLERLGLPLRGALWLGFSVSFGMSSLVLAMRGLTAGLNIPGAVAGTALGAMFGGVLGTQCGRRLSLPALRWLIVLATLAGATRLGFQLIASW
jgi:uncharacterized membrane protein YfcA